MACSGHGISLPRKKLSPVGDREKLEVLKLSIKIKMRENGKAIIRFNHPVEEQYFIEIMRNHRDDNLPHPKIILKNKDGNNVPPKPKPKPLTEEQKQQIEEIKRQKTQKVEPKVVKQSQP